MSKITKQVSFHGNRDYLSVDNTHIAKGGFAAGGEISTGNKGGTIVLPGPGTVAIFDDFLGDVVADEWNYAEGDTGYLGGVVANATGGVYRITTSTTAAGAPASVAALNGGVVYNWKPNQGNLHMVARVKLSALNGGHNVFVGLTDTGVAEMPLHDTGAPTLISTATNAVGWLIGGAAASITAGKWTGVGVNADTNASTVTGDTPTANVYDVLEIWGNEAGDAFEFYQNGVKKGALSSPVLSTRALVPTVAGFARDTGGWTIDTDYLNVSANRDTGL